LRVDFDLKLKLISCI